MQIFVASVLPAPDSPETRTDCERIGRPREAITATSLSAPWATQYTCGGMLENGSSARWYSRIKSSPYRSSHRNGLTLTMM